jgi:hypothetical protein
MLDPRLREWPALYLAGLLWFALLAACCLNQFASGLALGEVLCIPFHARSCRRNFPRFYGMEEEPFFFAGEMFFWLWFGLVFAGIAWYFQRQLVHAGGLFATARERCRRRIGRMRRRIDAGIFLHLAKMVPAGWESIQLELEWVTRQGEERLLHRVAGPEGHARGVAYSQHLLRATAELLDLFQKHGEAFQRTVYTLVRGPDRRWKPSLTVE